jgi:oligoendopeptidase F
MQTELLPSWNLDDLFSGMDDPGIEETLKRELLRAKEFAAEFKGRINSPSLTAEQLLCAVKTYENIAQESDKPLEYASLLFAADTSIPERGAFMQRMQERTSEIAIELIFFELELLALPDGQVKRLLLDPVLSGYSHYIKAARLFSPHRLTEPEEKILEETANTGRRAFTRLFEETVSNAAFSVDIKGEIKEMNLQSLLALQREPDRDVRKASAESLTKGLLANARTLTFIFNTLLQDKATIDRLRRYNYPEESRHLSNELDRETVELVVGTAVDYYPIVRRYYNLKRKVLGYDGLCHYDRYAPLFELKERVPFSHAKEIVLDSFHKFSPEMSDAAGKFFEGCWIDAEVRPGKRGGAFCSYATPDLHPYVLVNYLYRTDDVMTLAHELGEMARYDRSWIYHATKNGTIVDLISGMAAAMGR